MKTILVGFDGSAPALRAAQEAGALAKQLEMGLRLVFVVSPASFLLGPDLSGEVYVQLHDLQVSRGRELLEQARTALQPLGVPVETALGEGPPAQVLLEWSQAPEVAMVALGAQSGHALTRMFLGSVTYRLMHVTQKPVLVVH